MAQPPWTQRIAPKQSLSVLQQRFQTALDLHRQGKLSNAAKLYEEVIFYNQKHFGALHLLGVICGQNRQFERAVELISKAIKIDPRNAEAYYNRGIVLKELKRYESALLSYGKAISLKQNYFEAYYNRGIVQLELSRFGDALADNDKAIVLKRDFAEAYHNRGMALKELGRFDEALASFDRSIELKPEYAEAYSNRGYLLSEFMRLEDALASYEKAIALKPDYAEPFFGKSRCLLLRGQYSEGWELYEWRWRMEKTSSKQLLTDRPAFNLEDRKRVLVWAEQGVGDEVMFGSMISEFRHLCAQLIVQLDERLIPLVSRSISNDVVFLPTKSPVPQDFYDQHISIGSISRYLRNNEESFATARSGYLIPDRERTNEIRTFLTNSRVRRICGISWRSKNKNSGDSRSIKLNDFLQFVFMKDFSFVNLQYGETDAEIEQARTELGIEVISYDKVDKFNDLDGLACLIQSCDVVVSIDNSTVHLAGALGKDVRILLPRTPDWRWQLDRDDSPWYSSATLYRQSDDGDWASAFAKIRADLQKET